MLSEFKAYKEKIDTRFYQALFSMQQCDNLLAAGQIFAKFNEYLSDLARDKSADSSQPRQTREASKPSGAHGEQPVQTPKRPPMQSLPQQ